MKDTKNLLEVGTVVNTHGIHGEIKITPWTDAPEQLLALKSFYAQTRQGLVKYNVEKSKLHKFSVLAKLKGIEDMNSAEMLKGTNLYAERSELPPLEENTHFITDLIGLSVVCEDGESIGTISDIFPTGSNDVYVAKDDEGREVLIPAIKSVVLKIDMETKTITVAPKEGWLPK